jgi:hypothetical protein
MTRPGSLKSRGFLVLEMLIAGLILTSGIAATMYLFRMGLEHLERAKISNTLSAKLIQTSGLIQTLDLEKKKGMEDMGDGVTMAWDARRLAAVQPLALSVSGKMAASSYELFLYRIHFTLSMKGALREYSLSVFRYRSLTLPKDEAV